MKKQFQSKAVPRGTRTIWRYLGALFLIFTLGIGQMWAADDIYYVAMVQNVAEDGTLSGTSGTLKVVKYTASTKKYAETDAVSWNLSSPSVGCKGSGVSKCSDISDYSKWNQGSGSQKAKGPKFSGTTTLSLGSLTATKITFIGYRTNNSAGGTLQIGTEDAKTTVKKPSSTFGSDCVIEYTGSFTGDVSVVASHEHTGVFVITVPATAPTNYTVTINPNGGAYASTPDGWTASAGVYTKSVASGTSFTPPAGLTKGTDDLSWKDGDNKPVTFPTTISGNVTYVAQWTAHTTSTDATLSDLKVNGTTVTGFAAATEEYNVELPLGTTSVPTVTGTAADANAKSVVVTSASSLPGATTVVVTAEDNSTTKTYTINFTVASTKDLHMVFKTGVAPCHGTGATSASIFSDNASVSSYINKITFTNVEGDGDNGKENGSSLDVGKKAGNMFTLSAKSGYAMSAMYFAAKIQDNNCEYSLNGGDWTTLTSTNKSDNDCYTVFSNEEVHEFRLRSTGTSGVWIRNMQLTMIQACTPKTIAWTAEPADEYELGSSPAAIAASANNGTITYASSNSDVIAVNGSTGALNLKALGTVTLSASVPAGNGVTYCDQPAQVSKANVKTYYLVTFDGQNGDAAATVKYYGGAAIALPSAPDYPGYNFQGWFDAATGGNKITEAITPTASRTVYAQWIAQCDGATITTQPTGANYITGRTPVDLVCEATAGNGGALTYEWFTCDDELKANPVAASATPSTAAVGTYYYFCKVTEAGCDVEAFSNVVTITVADKDPVCIIKATPTSENEATADGAYKGSAFFKGSNAKKLSSGYDYVGVQLMAGKSFLATDKVVLNQAADLGSASDITKFYVFTETPASGKSYATVDNATPQKGNNWFAMPAELVGESSFYIGRVDSKCNPTLGYLAVYRAMNPELMAIKIDGRDGEIDALNDKHFNVTIPYEAVLTSLTVVPTIVRNAAHATTPEAVISNEGAWVLGDNIYRVMDKDGDYTDYTITLTRDVLKHAVKFYDGSTVYETLEVVDGESIAVGDVPADPEKEDYIFQGWAETAGGDAVDVTSFTISAAKNFYAKWVSDGAIKLIVDGTSGKELNTTDYITGVTIQTDATGGVKLAGTVSDVNSVKDLTRVIAYNAKSSKTKIQIKAYNTNASSRTFVVKGLVEGTTEVEDLASITLGNKETKTTDWIEFNNDDAKNRTIYIFSSSSASDIRFLQVKVIDDGETATKVAGEVGYSLSFDHGRFFGLKETTAQFEGLSVDIASSDCQPLSSSVVKVKEASMSFTAAAPVLLKVTTANNKTYYVANSTSGTTNETAKTGESEFNLAAGTWFINAGASEVQFTKIAFELPKAAKPVVADLANVEYCQGSAIDALTVSATVSDGGTMLYQWYKDGVKIDGAEAATYQPTADGEYYVVVVNTKAGHQNSDPTQSNTITVTGYAATVLSSTTGAENWPGTNVTISVTATGKNLHYAWYTCDDAMGTNPVAVDPAVDAAELNVTVGAADTYYKVVVSGDCGDAQEAIITVVARQAVALQDVTGNMTWDFSKANDGSAVGSNLCNDEVLANVHGIKNNSDFKSDNIKATANKFSSNKLQASMIMFHTTVPGAVIVKCSNTDNNKPDRYLMVNGVETELHSTNKTVQTYAEYVPAGDVVLTVGGDGNMFNFTSVEFKVDNDLEPYRDDEWLAPGELGTICIPQGAVAVGADIYELVGKEPQYGKIVFESVEHMKPGKPYLFQAKGTRIDFILTDETPASEPDNENSAMKGTFVDLNLTELDNVYYFADHALWSCDDLTSLSVPANRAYVKMDEVQALQNPNAAPGRRRVVLGVHGEQVVTGVENLNASEQPIKLLINGQIFILRGEKMFDVTGKLVK